MWAGHHTFLPWGSGTSPSFTSPKSECSCYPQGGGGGSNDSCISSNFVVQPVIFEEGVKSQGSYQFQSPQKFLVCLVHSLPLLPLPYPSSPRKNIMEYGL